MNDISINRQKLLQTNTLTNNSHTKIFIWEFLFLVSVKQDAYFTPQTKSYHIKNHSGFVFLLLITKIYHKIKILVCFFYKHLYKIFSHK